MLYFLFLYGPMGEVLFGLYDVLVGRVLYSLWAVKESVLHGARLHIAFHTSQVLYCHPVEMVYARVCAIYIYLVEMI